MRYALISDVHGNLPALEAVLADVHGRGEVEGIYHLGDLVGYAPWPNEVVGLLRERGIAGNYDSTIATDYDHCGCKADSPRGTRAPGTPRGRPSRGRDPRHLHCPRGELLWRIFGDISTLAPVRGHPGPISAAWRAAAPGRRRR